MAHPTGNGLSMREFDALRLRQEPPQGGFFFSDLLRHAAPRSRVEIPRVQREFGLLERLASAAH